MSVEPGAELGTHGRRIGGVIHDSEIQCSRGDEDPMALFEEGWDGGGREDARKSETSD